MKINEVIIREYATDGATSAGNVSTVVSPHIAIGKDRFKKSYHCLLYTSDAADE